MSNETYIRAVRALITQNKFCRPAHQNTFTQAYVVGEHVWLVEHAAKDWIRETRDEHPLESVNYGDAYAYAKANNISMIV